MTPSQRDAATRAERWLQRARDAVDDAEREDCYTSAFSSLGTALGLDRLAVAGVIETKAWVNDDYDRAMKDGSVTTAAQEDFGCSLAEPAEATL